MNNEELPLVSIVTINFNSTSYTADLLKSLREVIYGNLEIFVVDNNSDVKPLELKEKYPEIQLILSNENLGFAGGNNLAIKKARGKYILLLNNDTEVEKDFLTPVIELMESNNSIGIVSSKILYYDFPDTIQYAGNDGINLYTGRGFTIGYNQKDSVKYSRVYKTGIAHGAMMMVREDVFKKVGLLPEQYFLYYEELDFCEHTKKAGYEIWYDGRSKIYHKESKSIGKLSPLKVYYITRNRLIFIRRNTKGWKKLFPLLFFYLVAFPKGIIRYFILLDFLILKSFIRGALWNVLNPNLNLSKNIINN